MTNSLNLKYICLLLNGKLVNNYVQYNQHLNSAAKEEIRNNTSILLDNHARKISLLPSIA